MTFAEAVGEPTSDEHSLDRIDPDGNYEPGNVRWVTRTEQAANKCVDDFDWEDDWDESLPSDF